MVDQMYAPQELRVTMLRLLAGQTDDLVALQAGRAIDWGGGLSIELQILFGTNDKQSSIVVQVIQALVIQIRTIHYIDAATELLGVWGEGPVKSLQILNEHEVLFNYGTYLIKRFGILLAF